MTRTPFEDEIDWEPSAESLDGALWLLRRQAELVIAIATRGPRIEEVEEEYVARRRKLRDGLRSIGLSDPLPWSSLWTAYAALKEFGTWAERRAEVRRLVDPVVEELQLRSSATTVEDVDGPPVSWPELESRIGEMKSELSRAATLDGYQDVGRRCREITIAAVNLVFSEDMVPSSAEFPGAADAKRRLDYYLAARHPGASEDELRGFLRRLLTLAHAVTHDADAAPLTAFAAAQGTVSLVRILQEAARIDVQRRDS